jgi:hypothetical protein
MGEEGGVEVEKNITVKALNTASFDFRAPS